MLTPSPCSEDTELAEIEETLLLKALRLLQGRGKASVFEDEDDGTVGVKFAA